ncbi:odorant receptor coreceptor-like [Cryptotermes secundus]|uniref:odorant receptor coreceptor-like n=1 Tax=Cryptotermes secundus TaxID=105785 RepID=UPI001454BCA3|nr:odorant receptor coreceptor-like [Cryptotermes secundus]
MKVPENKVEPKECLYLNLALLKLGSIFPFDEVSSLTWINILYKGYTTFTVTLFYSVSIAAPLFIICEDYPLQDGIEVMSILLTQLRSGMKLMTFILYRKEVQNLIRTLYENFYIHDRNLTAEESSIIRQATGYARKITTSYIILYCITGLSMILHPLTPTRVELGEKDTLNYTAGPHRSLPFKSYYPNWDSTKSPQYEIEYAAQATLTALEAWCMGCIDSFCVTLMICVGYQFDLLSISLKNINKNALMKSGPEIYKKRIEGNYPEQILKNPALFVIQEKGENRIRKNVNNRDCLNRTYGSTLRFGCGEGSHTSSTMKSFAQVERENLTYVKECIKYHQSLLMYVADMNKSFSSMFFVVFLTASILICLLGFQVLVMPPQGLMFARVLLHSVCTVLELGFFCWFGSELMHKSQRVHQAAYDCDWQNNCNGAKFICMIIMRAQRPVAVRAGLFGNLCLPTFSSLMKNAYSYLALLRQFHEVDDA